MTGADTVDEAGQPGLPGIVCLSDGLGARSRSALFETDAAGGDLAQARHDDTKPLMSHWVIAPPPAVGYSQSSQMEMLNEDTATR